jgi:hypothetical protein
MKGERLRREDAEREWDVEGGESALPPLSLRSAAAGSTGRRWWGRTVLWAVFAIVLIECAFIVRLDILNSPATSSSHTSLVSESASRLPGHDGVLKTNATRTTSGVCSKEWLEKADRVHYSRDFKTDPVVVEAGGEQQVLLCPSILSSVTRMFSALFMDIECVCL